MSGWDTPNLAHISELERRCAAKWFKINPASIPGPPTGLLVGERPGPSTHKKLPLFPYPPNSAGGRLLKMSRIGIETYLGRLIRVNLFESFDLGWDADKATEAAKAIMDAQPEGRRVVVLGTRVAQAFGLTAFFKLEDHDGRMVCAIPHPSGRNLLYNDANYRVGAIAAVQWAANCIEPPSIEQVIKRNK